MEKRAVFNSLLVGLCYKSTHLLTDVRFYMKYSTVFSPVNIIIQTRIVLRVLPDNQKTFTQEIEISILTLSNTEIRAKTMALLMLKL